MTDTVVDLARGKLLGRKLRRSEARKPYLAPEGLLRAANTALALEWPLLLSGEPGCGKSDFAWAAASAVASLQKGATAKDIEEAEPYQAYVRSETRARDLLYHYDALRRFGDTQYGDKSLASDARAYVTLEALGAALLSERPCVVLVDEIDKAPRDLPNDLLRELEQGDFKIVEIPDDLPNKPLNRNMQRPRHSRLPLIIITSNNERQLPDPFLRRCVFYHIPFPREERMAQIVESHFRDERRRPDQELWRLASRIFYAVRDKPPLQKKPSTVELLGWLRALVLDDDATLRQRLREVAGMIKDDTTAVELVSVPFFKDERLLLGCLLKLKDDQHLLGLPR